MPYISWNTFCHPLLQFWKYLYKKHLCWYRINTYSLIEPATGLRDFLIAYTQPSSRWWHLYTLPNSPCPISSSSKNSWWYLETLASWMASLLVGRPASSSHSSHESMQHDSSILRSMFSGNWVILQGKKYVLMSHTNRT